MTQIHPTTGVVGSKRPPRRRLVLVIALLGMVVVLGAVWWWRGTRHLVPPVVDLSEVDLAVAEVVATSRAAVLANPSSGALWGRLGMVLRAHDFADEADACFAQAERLDPKEGRWPYLRGLTLVLTDPPTGLACLRRAVELLPDEPAVAFRLVEVLLEQGQLDEASRLLSRYLADQPDNLRARLLQARLFTAREDYKAALQIAESLLTSPQTRGQAHRLAADLCQRLGQHQRAENLLAAARQLSADRPWHDPLVAEVERLRVGFQPRLMRILAQEDARQAIAELRSLVQEYPREANGWLQLGQLLRAEEQFAEAEQALRRAVTEQPDLVEGWFTLGVVLLLQQRPKEALEAFSRVVKLKPDHALAHYNLGVCLHREGKSEQARLAWQQALLCEPGHPLATRALQQLGK